jgi:biotin-dependent carboxylase-like uncharacterized protein
MSLRVLEPGLCSLIVDHGRLHSRSLGVPVGGAADRAALAVGNAMLGNPPAAAALEITLVGPALVALEQVGAVVVGAPFQLSSGRQSLAVNRSFTLDPAEELHVGGTERAARAYLCVVGGFQTPVVLGSRSSLAPLQSGVELPCSASATAIRFVRGDFLAEIVPALAPAPECRLRVIPGPQVDWFPLRHEGTPFVFDPADCWTVSPASNRMGLRLRGPHLPVPPHELVSEPVAPGAIQVMPDGQAIILGVDGQTIGGYPKVAQVISADLDLLGQLRPGVRISFDTVTVEVAQEIYRARARRLDGVYQRLRLAAKAF